MARVTKKMPVDLLGNPRANMSIILTWDSASPFEIVAEFEEKGKETAEWRISRELLHEGLTKGRAGDPVGDLAIYTTRAYVYLRMVDATDPQRLTIIAADLATVRAFVERTLAWIPLGAEPMHDWDTEARSLFSN